MVTRSDRGCVIGVSAPRPEASEPFPAHSAATSLAAQCAEPGAPC